jgi:hypothetical protein
MTKAFEQGLADQVPFAGSKRLDGAGHMTLPEILAAFIGE